MADGNPIVAQRFGSLCRTVAAALIAGVWRRHPIGEVRDRLAALPAREEAAVVGGTLAALFFLALLAAQFGPVGLLLYLLAVVLIVN